MTLPRPRMVLCVGEPLIALVPTNAKPAEIVDQLDVVTAGAELNVAIHLARFGFHVRFAGMVGDDPWGSRLCKELLREHIDVSALDVDAARPTGFYVKEIGDGRSVMRYFRQGSAASGYGRISESAHAGVDHLHITGITPALSESCAGLTRSELGAHGSRSTSFDVNFRETLWGVERAAPELHSLAQLASIVFVGLDEARQLWGCENAKAVRDMFPETEELVVKDGAGEATAFTRDGSASAPALDVDIVDSIGAGDAFASAYLAARWRGHDLRGALHAGHALAATVITSSSDHGESRVATTYLDFGEDQVHK